MIYKLIIDDRERAIYPYLDTELYNVLYEKRRIQIGDYAILNSSNNIIACLERKTLEDFATSIKDGRYHNKNSMIDLRKKTSCRLFFIIEGIAFPKPSDSFARKPYKDIESAIFHLMMRDGFYIIQTANIQHTAQKLSRLIKSLENLKEPLVFNKYSPPIRDTVHVAKTVNEQIATELEDIFEEIEAEKDGNDLLQERKVKSDIDIVREMWACFKGISTITADIFMQQATVGDIIKRKLTQIQIENLKYPSGRNINRKLSYRLLHPDIKVEIRLLTCMPRISIQTAKAMIGIRRLKPLLSYESGALSIMTVNGKKVGEARANAIKKYFEIKT